jgi:hypothetical protein
MNRISAGQLLDIVSRAQSVIEESDGADEHQELIGELREVTKLFRDEIGASHMGIGADVVILERGDA